MGLPVTCEALNEDPGVHTRMQHASTNVPPVLNNDCQDEGQSVLQWQTLPVVVVPVSHIEKHVKKESCSLHGKVTLKEA